MLLLFDIKFLNSLYFQVQISYLGLRHSDWCPRITSNVVLRYQHDDVSDRPRSNI